MAEDKALDDKDTLEKHGIKDGDRLYFKDLGPQVGYRTVSDVCNIHRCTYEGRPKYDTQELR